MEPERWERISALFERALELPAGERDAFLVDACGDDAELLAEARALVRASGRDTIVDRVVGRAVEDTTGPGDASALRLRLGAYRVLDTIGIGGMGTVYLAERADDEFEQRVAIKVVRAGRFDELGRRRLRAERQILAALEHPFIARLLDGGTTEDGVPYFVMEYVDGVPIHEFVERHELTIRARIQLMLQVCDAVAYAHSRLVVHRDLKPGNILISQNGTPKLLDFGIARLLAPVEGDEGAHTITLAGMLTPDYASPEQIRGEAVGTASDTYSLGVVLYRLLTGRLPHDLRGRSPAEAERIVSTHDPQRPSLAASTHASRDPAGTNTAARDLRRAGDTDTLRRSLEGDLDAILLKALRRDPAERYASVVEFATDLRRHLDRMPISARTPTVGYRLSKFVRRNAATVSAAAAAFLVLTVSLGFASVQNRTANLARQDAEGARDEAQRALATSRTVTQYLTRVLSAADPRQNLGSDISVREALDRGREALADLDEEPAVKAEVLETMGALYYQLGRYDVAAQLNGEAVALRRDGGDMEKLVQVMNQLAMSLIQSGVRDSAAVVLEEAIRVAAPALGDQHDGVLAALSNLAVAYGRLGRESDALAMYRRLVDVERSALEPDDPVRAYALNNLSLQLIAVGSFDEAERHAREAASLREAVHGSHHPDVAHSRMNLGVVLREADRLDEAEPLLRSALQTFADILDHDHPRIAEAQFALGTLLVQRGSPADLASADTILHRALAIRIAAVGERHAAIGWHKHALGLLEARRGNPEAAQTWLEQAVELRTDLAMDAPRVTAESLLELALVRSAGGNRAGAVDAADRALTIASERLPADHIFTARTRAIAGMITGAEPPVVDAAIGAVRERVGAQHRWVRQACEHAARQSLTIPSC